MAKVETPFEDVLGDVMNFMAKGQPEALGSLLENPSERFIKLAYRLIYEEVVKETLPLLGKYVVDDENTHEIFQLNQLSSEQKYLLLDGIIDSIYVLCWTAVAFGFHKNNVFWDAWRAVQFANMDKFRNGVIRDSGGKIQKPEGWEPPDEHIKNLLFNASNIEYTKKYKGAVLATGTERAEFYGKDTNIK